MCVLLVTDDRHVVLMNLVPNDKDGSIEGREHSKVKHDEGLQEMYALMRSTLCESSSCKPETFFFKKYPWLDFFRDETAYITRMQSKLPCPTLCLEVIEALEQVSLEFCQEVNKLLLIENTKILALTLCGPCFRKLDTSASVKQYAKHLFGFLSVSYRKNFIF